MFRETSCRTIGGSFPGLLNSTTNFIEHPELVARRIACYAELVAREHVIDGGDCGFATFARSQAQIEPEIVWAKLAAMAEGARLAFRPALGRPAMTSVGMRERRLRCLGRSG